MISIPAPRQSWIDSFIELIDKPKLSEERVLQNLNTLYTCRINQISTFSTLEARIRSIAEFLKTYTEGHEKSHLVRQTTLLSTTFMQDLINNDSSSFTRDQIDHITRIMLPRLLQSDKFDTSRCWLERYYIRCLTKDIVLADLREFNEFPLEDVEKIAKETKTICDHWLCERTLLPIVELGQKMLMERKKDPSRLFRLCNEKIEELFKSFLTRIQKFSPQKTNFYWDLRLTILFDCLEKHGHLYRTEDS